MLSKNLNLSDRSKAKICLANPLRINCASRCFFNSEVTATAKTGSLSQIGRLACMCEL